MASFAAESSARALKAELEPKVAGVHIVKALVGGETYYRVLIGNFPSRADAQATAERLAGLGYQVLIMESSERPLAALLQNGLVPLLMGLNSPKS